MNPKIALINLSYKNILMEFLLLSESQNIFTFHSMYTYACIEDFAWNYFYLYIYIFIFTFVFCILLYRIISITMNMTLDSFFINEIESNFIYCVRFSIKVLYISALYLNLLLYIYNLVKFVCLFVCLFVLQPLNYIQQEMPPNVH